MLLCNSSTTIDWVGTIASIIIAASAVFQFGYLIIIQAKKERKRNEKEWFHRLIIEPKIEEIYTFFENTEKELENLQTLSGTDFTIEEALKKSDDFKFFIFRFRKSFVHFIYAIDRELALEIKYTLDSLVDSYAEKLYSDTFDQTDISDLSNKFFQVKQQIIARIYKWNN